VLIQTTNGRKVWTTVGVGQNIVEASWEALSDGYLYGLLHADDQPSAKPAVAHLAAAHG
jgi:2-isopropylmalate synthase